MFIGAHRTTASHNESVLSDMLLGHNTIPWCSSFKYLGISFITGKRLKVDCDLIKRKFFAACNCILGNSTHGHEIVRLALQESYCLPNPHPPVWIGGSAYHRFSIKGSQCCLEQYVP